MRCAYHGRKFKLPADYHFVKVFDSVIFGRRNLFGNWTSSSNTLKWTISTIWPHCAALHQPTRPKRMEMNTFSINLPNINRAIVISCSLLGYIINIIWLQLNINIIIVVIALAKHTQIRNPIGKTDLLRTEIAWCDQTRKTCFFYTLQSNRILFFFFSFTSVLANILFAII